MSLSPDAALRKDARTKTPALQHRHFAFIARAIADMPESVNRLTVARKFATELAASNPNFDRARFLAACRPD